MFTQTVCPPMFATSLGVVPSGECLLGEEGLVSLIGVVVCLLAAAAGPVVH